MFWADGMYVHGSGLFESPDSQCAAEYMDFENTEPEPLLEEVLAAIDQLKSGKSPGLDGIPAELIKNAGLACKMAIHYLCLVNMYMARRLEKTRVCYAFQKGQLQRTAEQLLSSAILAKCSLSSY